MDRNIDQPVELGEPRQLSWEEIVNWRPRRNYGFCDWTAEGYFEILKSEWHAGSETALLDGLKFALTWDMRPPEWIVHAWTKAISEIQNGRTRDLCKALGINLAGRKERSLSNDYEARGKIYRHVNELRALGNTVEAACEIVANQYRRSGSLIRTLYYREKNLEEESQSDLPI